VSQLNTFSGWVLFQPRNCDIFLALVRTSKTVRIGVLGAAFGLAALTAPAAVKLWQPTVRDGFASTPANWSGRSVPTSADDIVLDATSSRSLVWDAPNGGLPTSVNSWRQDAAYTGRVTISTLFPGPDHNFTNFVIRGNLTLNGGAWYPGWNSTTNGSRLTVTVGGNFTLGAGAVVDASEAGYTRDGPGYPGAHGGTGRANAPTYGSVTAPSLPGSGSGIRPGGGAILLTVSGASVINGAIRADGSGGNRGTGGGAGGSILFRTGTLTGSGSISANGGQDAWHGGGSGGRLAVILTRPGAEFDAFAVANLTTYGTPSQHHGRNGGAGTGCAAGTVYLETSRDGVGGGRVIVDNNGFEATDSRTTLPSALNPRERLEDTRWFVQNGATVALVTNAQVGAIAVSEDAVLDLGAYTLKTRALTLGGTNCQPGVYGAEDLGYRLVTGTGRVAVQLPGAPDVANRRTSRLTATSATLSGALLAGAGPDTTVSVFWGPTDGGRTPERWASRQAVTPDSSGLLSATVTNLARDCGLWFTLFASNGKGEWWADPPLFFMTGAPVVTAVEPTVVESTLAPVAFVVTRPASCAQGAVDLGYTLRGTASNDVDYVGAAAGTIMLAPGQTQAFVRVFPGFDLAVRPTRTVTLELDSGRYPLGSHSSDTVTLAGARVNLPDWWDAVPVRRPHLPETTKPDAFWSALTATNLPLTPRLEIKLRSIQAVRFARDPAVVLPQAERLVTLACELKDGHTFAFWAAYLLANLPNRAAAGERLRA